MFDNTNKPEVRTCILCGEQLHEQAEKIEIRCDFCGKIAPANLCCEQGHYICDECDKMTVNELVKYFCFNYKGDDPIELAVRIMNNPKIRMHGAEHHFITPAVLLTSVFNSIKSSGDLKMLLQIAEERAQTETPNSCHYNLGSCGAAIGAGIFLSVFTGREPLTENDWSLMNSLIASALKNITEEGGPRCCKRDTYISILTAIDFLKEKFLIELPKSEPKCTFSLRNKSCKREDCQFYNLANSLV